MDKKYRDLIKEEYLNCVNNTIKRIQKEPTYRPFHKALLSDDVLFWSGFERSFSTSFGQSVIEEMAKIVAISNGATEVARQKETYTELDSAQEEGIAAHITTLRSKAKTPPLLSSTVEEILRLPTAGSVKRVRVISDFWWRKDGVDNYISLKTVKPNIDQTAVAKEDCLRLRINNTKCNAYFGLPYNPYGENKSDYNHNPPMGIFDFQKDPVVLIGREMWDTIGGEGCYDEIIEIAREVGKETRKSIEAIKK